MTVKQLTDIAFILIKNEYNGKMPECVLSSEVIKILINRAIEKGINVF
jgi:hypothetical protein